MAHVIILLVGILTAGLRVALIWKHRLRGCDAYYFLLSSEVFAQTKRLPIVLPSVYTLERTEQWYPPGFSVLLSLLPRPWLEKHYWSICPTLDALVAATTAAATYMLTSDLSATAVAGLCYAANTASMVDCVNLNSRIVGLLLFSLTMLFTIGFAFGSPVYAVPAALFGAAMLLTHKSSSQLFYFTMVVMAVGLQMWQFAAVLAGVVATALALSRGFMVKVWKGQYDILSFWSRHWRELGAHEIYGSPVYRSHPERDKRVHTPGWQGLRKSLSYLGLNAFILPVLWVGAHYGHLNQLDQAILWWVGSTYLLGGLTQLVPWLRFAGEGYRYLKLAALPVAYLCAVPLIYQWQPPWVYFTLLGASAIIGLMLMQRLFRFMSPAGGSSVPLMSTGLQDVIDKLKTEDNVTNVLCIPSGTGDALGYYTRLPVLRGTHNVPFRWVEPLFPVHRLPLDYLVKGYNVSHLVILTDYVDTETLKLDNCRLVLQSGEYELYATRQGKEMQQNGA